MTRIVGNMPIPATREDLNGKADKDHGHEIRQVDGLDNALNGLDRDLSGLQDDIDDLAGLHLTGEGFPEGKVPAPVGAVYTDTQATAGAVRWIKASGTSSTGWRVLWGRTGRRNVSSSLLEGMAGNLYISRTNSRVSISGSNIRPPSTGDVNLANLPAGFRPIATEQGTGLETSTLRPVTAFYYPPQNLQARSIGAANSWFHLSISFETDDPWPASLPGTPA